MLERGPGREWIHIAGLFFFFINKRFFSTVSVFFLNYLHFLREMVEVQCTPLPFHTGGGVRIWGSPLLKGSSRF